MPKKHKRHGKKKKRSPMGLSAKVGSFNTGTGAVSSTVVVNDVGFQPKVVFFWWNGRTGTVDASGRANHQRGFGIGVSSTDRRYATSLSQDTPTSMLTNTTQGNAACIGITTTGDAIDGLMDVQSMDSGGFTLVVDDAFVSSYRVHYLALGGSDITNVSTGQFTGNAAGGTGNQDITSLAFQPDFVMIFGTGQTTANNTVRADSRIMLGMADGTRSGVWSGGSNDGAANAQAVSYCKSDEFIAHLNTAQTSTEDRASFTGFLSNGFNINWLEVTTGGSVNHFVAIKGGLVRVDNLLTQTNTSTPIAESGFGFSPKAVLLVSAGKAESTADTVTDDDEWSMGAFTGAAERVAMSMSDDDAAGTAVVGTGLSHDEAYQNLNATTGAVEGEMDVQSIDSDGFTMIMDDADPVQAFVFYAAFGQAALTQTTSGGITPTGGIFKDGRKVISGGITPSGTALKLTAKTFSGALSSIIGTISKESNKVLSGAITSIVGTITTSRLYNAIFSGILSSSGDILKQDNKSLSSNLTSSGSISNQTGKTISGAISDIAGSLNNSSTKEFSGEITSSGVVNKQTDKSFFGTLTSDGNLIKSINKLLSGILSSAGDLVGELIGGGIEYFQDVFGEITPIGTINKLVTKAFSGDLISSGSITKSAIKIFSGILTSSGSILKEGQKLLSGLISPVGDFTREITKSFSGNLLAAGNANKSTTKSISGVLTTIGDLIGTSVFTKILDGILSSSGNIVKSVNKSISGAITPIGSISKLINKIFSGILTSIGDLAADFIHGGISFFKSLSGDVTPIGSISKIPEKLISGDIASSGEISKNTAKILLGTLISSGNIVKQIGKFFSGILNFLGNLVPLNGNIQEEKPKIYLKGTRILTVSLKGNTVQIVELDGNRKYYIYLNGKK